MEIILVILSLLIFVHEQYVYCIDEICFCKDVIKWLCYRDVGVYEKKIIPESGASFSDSEDPISSEVSGRLLDSEDSGLLLDADDSELLPELLAEAGLLELEE